MMIPKTFFAEFPRMVDHFMDFRAKESGIVVFLLHLVDRDPFAPEAERNQRFPC